MPYKRTRNDNVQARRERVAKRRIEHAETQRQLAAYFGVSVATINNDLKVLDQQWREHAAQDTATHRARQLAELEHVKRWCWMTAPDNPRPLIQAIKLDAQITGTLAPPVFNFNMTFLVQLSKAIQDSGMSDSEAVEAFKELFAKKRQEALTDENG